MREIDVEQLDDLITQGASVIDVREPLEYAEARVPGAVLIPMGELGGRLEELDKDAPVYLICRSGHRSAVVGEHLSAAGYDAVNVVGGTLAWVRAGKPFDQGAD